MYYHGTDNKQGPRGFQGKEGPTGERGPAGPCGSIGKTGPTGERGLRGYSGEKGEKGDSSNHTQYCIKIYNVTEDLTPLTQNIDITNCAGGYTVLYSTDPKYFVLGIYIQKIDNKINIDIETNRQPKNIFLFCTSKSENFNCFSITSDQKNITFDFKDSDTYCNYFYKSSLLYLTVVWL